MIWNRVGMLNYATVYPIAICNDKVNTLLTTLVIFNQITTTVSKISTKHFKTEIHLAIFFQILTFGVYS